MKRILAMLVALSMLLAFVACSVEEAKKTIENNKKKETAETAGEETVLTQTETLGGETVTEPESVETTPSTTTKPPVTTAKPTATYNPGVYVPPSGGTTGGSTGGSTGGTVDEEDTGAGDSSGEVGDDNSGISTGNSKGTLPYPVESYPTKYMTKKLTRSQLDAIPLATNSMSESQLRQICLDYFELQLSFHWTPNQSIEKFLTTNHKIDTDGDGTKEIYRKYLNYGEIYGGIPYQTVSNGNLYRWFEYYDEETGIFYLSDAIANHGGYSATGEKNPGTKPFFNQCSVASYWGWGRVINSANFIWTADMNVRNGFIPVGFFTYNNALTITRFGEVDSTNPSGYDTINVIRDWTRKKGTKAMYECYALADPADLLVSSGHAMMVKSVNVVRKADGSIDETKSTITTIEQIEGWGYEGTLNGIKFHQQGGVDRVYTFKTLQSSKYIPFTFAEFHKGDTAFWDEFTRVYQAAYGQAGVDHVNALKASAGVEKVTFTVEGKKSDMTIADLQNATYVCNYVISDIFFTVKDPYGAVVAEHIHRTTQASHKTVSMNTTAKNALSKALKSHANGKNTVEIYAQVSTGEKIYVMTATLDK